MRIWDDLAIKEIFMKTLHRSLTDCVLMQFHWKSIELIKFSAILMNSAGFQETPVKPREVRWSPMQSSEVRWSLMNFVFVVSDSGRRPLLPTKYCQHLWCCCCRLWDFDIHIFIVLLPWIRPQSLVPGWRFCNNMITNETQKKFSRIFTSISLIYFMKFERIRDLCNLAFVLMSRV